MYKQVNEQMTFIMNGRKRVVLYFIKIDFQIFWLLDMYIEDLTSYRGLPCILSICFATSLINSIIQEHKC